MTEGKKSKGGKEKIKKEGSYHSILHSRLILGMDIS